MVSTFGGDDGIQTVHHTSIRAVGDGTFTKNYTGSTTGTTRGNNAFANGNTSPAVNNMLRQRALNLDNNNNPIRVPITTPGPGTGGANGRMVPVTVALPGGGSRVVQRFSNQYTLVPNGPNNESGTQNLGFSRQFLAPDGTTIGIEDTDREWGQQQTDIEFNVTNSPTGYTGTAPANDNLIRNNENAVPADATQRGGAIQTFPSGATKSQPVGTNLPQKARGGSGQTVDLLPTTP